MTFRLKFGSSRDEDEGRIGVGIQLEVADVGRDLMTTFCSSWSAFQFYISSGYMQSIWVPMHLV